jgi:methyltransferase (TIGR00027 family)
MHTGKPSRTAWAAAAHRAAHQVLEQGRIFNDPLALRIVGAEIEAITREAQERPSSRRMRIFIAIRTRFAEDALAQSVQCGVKQLVILGAGLDTFAYRSTLGSRLRVFEVDHPATQAWKRQRLADTGITLPGWLTFAPVDFEKDSLAEGLAAAGFDPEKPTFFTWLGVVPYLAEEVFWSTVAFIAGLQAAEVVFDYSNPPDSLPVEWQEAHERRAARVASLGEPWINYFETDQLHSRLHALGFSGIEDLGPRQIASRYFPDHQVPVPEQGGHIIRAVADPR